MRVVNRPCRQCGLVPMHGRPRHRPVCPYDLPDHAVTRVLAEHPELAAWDHEADLWYPIEAS